MKWFRNVDASAAGFANRIESALTKFSQAPKPADDITLGHLQTSDRSQTNGRSSGSVAPVIRWMPTLNLSFISR